MQFGNWAAHPRFAALVLSTFVLMVPAQASKTDKDYLSEGMQLYANGEFDAAREKLQVELSKTKLPARQLRIRFWLAKVELGIDPESGIKQLQQILQEEEKSLGVNHADTINTARFLGIRLKAMGRNSEAKKAYEVALKGESQLFGKDSPQAERTSRAIVEVDMGAAKSDAKEKSLPGYFQSPKLMQRFNARQGMLAFRKRNFNVAADEYKSSVEDNEHQKNVNQEELSKMLLALGETERIRGNYDTAEKALKRSSDFAVVKSDFGTQVSAMNLLGQCYEDRGREQDAIVLYTEAMGKSKTHGLVDGWIASCCNLATLYVNSGKSSQALSLLEKCSVYLKSQSFQRSKPPDDLARVNLSRADVLIATNKISEARMEIRKGLDLATSADPALWCLGRRLEAKCDFLVDRKEHALDVVDEALAKAAKCDYPYELVKLMSFKATILKSMNRKADCDKLVNLCTEQAKDDGNQLQLRQVTGALRSSSPLRAE